MENWQISEEFSVKGEILKFQQFYLEPEGQGCGIIIQINFMYYFAHDCTSSETVLATDLYFIKRISSPFSIFLKS